MSSGTRAATCTEPSFDVTVARSPLRVPVPRIRSFLNLSFDASSAFVMEPRGYLLHTSTAAECLVTFNAVVGDCDGPYPFFDDGRLIAQGNSSSARGISAGMRFR
jgi:hypothetical protein